MALETKSFAKGYGDVVKRSPQSPTYADDTASGSANSKK